MRRLLLVILALLTPVAAADETTSDCEPTQPWMGYATTDPARYEAENATVGGPSATPCEGEHWDGQDAVQGNEDPGHERACGQRLAQDDDDFFVGSCMSRDPNNGSADVLGANGMPATFRVSERDGRELYIAADVWMVARVATYGGACSADESGLEGDPACAGDAQSRGAVYYRDNTPGNFVFTTLDCCRITGPRVSEADCDQATYQRMTYEGDAWCSRDNTAVTFDAFLP